jgi:deoxyribose-phosphate aldolase
MKTMLSQEALIQLLDFTTLSGDETEQSIRAFCQQALDAPVPVAGLCLYPRWVSLAKECMKNRPVPIVTVCNFPLGNEPLHVMQQAIRTSLEEGADEIDIVIPYRSFMSGDEESVIACVEAAKEVCGNHCLKVILETGILQDIELIAFASQLAIDGGADFLKTSTGKAPVNATVDAATVMLEIIAAHYQETGRIIGFKAAGGIRTAEAAHQYVDLAVSILGEEYLDPATFRIGTSKLL